MDISKRLLIIANLVEKNSIVADIGTDHGFVPFYLLENNIADKVYLSEISKDCLNKAARLFDGKFEDRCDFILSDGLKEFVVKDIKVDTVIIAGMGGELISNILEQSLEYVKGIKTLILQPVQAPEMLRQYLIENKFEIIDEIIVRDKKFYEIIVAKYSGIENESREEYYVPRNVSQINSDFIEYIKYNIDKRKKILQKISFNDIGRCRVLAKTGAKIANLNREIFLFEEVLHDKNK